MHKTLERVPVEGGELTLARWANPSARPVLLVHGITGSHMVWPLVVQALAGEYDLYAPDLRGRGGSRSVPGPYGLSRHCRDLTAVLAHYAIAEVDIVGHSLGAYIALELAATAPERVARLVLVDGGIGLPLPEGASAEAATTSAPPSVPEARTSGCPASSGWARSAAASGSAATRRQAMRDACGEGGVGGATRGLRALGGPQGVGAGS